MATWSLTEAPKWAPNAIATDKGWVDPKNGEIIVACKRLEDAVSYLETFGKGVIHHTKNKARGGARKGAGRKTNAERARIAAEKAEAEKAKTESTSKELVKDDVKDDVKKDKPKSKPRKKASRKKPATKRNEGSEAK